MPRFHDSYRRIARLYDLCASLYSAGRIPRSKRVILDLIKAGDLIVFPGAGNGREAIMAAKRGAKVLAVDRSPAMALRLQNRARAEGTAMMVLVQDIKDLKFERDTPDEGYSLTAAHYFLNVFAPDEMRAQLAWLAHLTRAKGRVVIADFAPPPPGLRGMIQRFYYYTALISFRLLARNAWHPIYDYAVDLPAAGLELQQTVDFPLAFGLIPGYRVWITTKPR